MKFFYSGDAFSAGQTQLKSVYDCSPYFLIIAPDSYICSRCAPFLGIVYRGGIW